MLAHQIAFDPDGPTELTCSDGLVIPWRPIRYAGAGNDGYPRGIEIHPEYLADWDLLWDLPGEETGALWIPCPDCELGTFYGPDFEEPCVKCRGTGELPYAFEGQDFTFGVIPIE